MLRPIRTLHIALTIAATTPVGALGAQQMTTGNIVAASLGAGYLALSIGSIVRLAGHSRPAAVGDRVRGPTASVTGTVTGIDADSITVRTIGGDTRLARKDARDLRVLQTGEHKWAQGWAIGLAVGATTGVIAGWTSTAPAEDPTCEFFCPTRSEDAVFGGVLLGVTGSVAGALIGAATRGDRWSRISRFLESTGVRAEPRTGAIGLTARIRF